MRHRTLLVFTVGFIAGICFASRFSVPWLALAALSAFLIAALIFAQKPVPVIIASLGFVLGAFRLLACYPPGCNIEAFAGPMPVTIYGFVSNDPKLDPHKVSFVLAADDIQTRQGSYAVRDTTDVLVHGAAFSTFQTARYGDRVVVIGTLQKQFPVTNPGEFDMRTEMLRRGVAGELVVQRPFGARILQAAGAAGIWANWASRGQSYCESQLRSSLTPDEAGILYGILFGDRRAITPEEQREFAETGTSHILATAGLHVGILALVLTWFFGLLPIPRKVSAFVIIVLLWLFACLAGGRPSVVRAVTVATVYFAGRLFERIPDIPTTLGVAGLGILVLSPLDLFDSDFQMSFATVIGLSLWMPLWNKYWASICRSVKNRVLRWQASKASELVGLSLIAQLCAAPLIAYYFSQISILSLPVNLLVVPLLFVLIPASIVVLILSFASRQLGALLSRFFLHPILWTILHFVSWVAHCRYSSIAVGQPPAILVVSIYVAGYALALWKKKKGRIAVQRTPVEATP
jgi:competence protein ComEC